MDQLWEQTYFEVRERTEQDIAAVLLDMKPSIRLRLDEYRTIEFDADQLWAEINEEEDADRYYFASHIQKSEEVTNSLRRRASRAIEHLASVHAELEANEAERQARSENSRVVSFG